MKKNQRIKSFILVSLLTIFSVILFNCDGMLSLDLPIRNNPDDPSAEADETDAITAAIVISDSETTYNPEDLISLGDFVLGSSLRNFDFTITNTGGTTLYLTGSETLALTGNSAYTVAIIEGDTVINTEETVTFRITFTPTSSPATCTAELMVESNAGDFHLYLTAAVIDGILPPTGFIANASNWHTVLLTWNNDSPDADSYIIERKGTTDIWTELVTVQADTTSYTDEACAGSTEYAYRIYAKNTNNETSGYSEAAASTPAEVAAPTNLTVTIVDTNTNYLSWTDNSDNESYFTIYRKTPLESEYTNIASRDPNVTDYTDDQCTAGVQYTYMVEAYNDVSGASSPSNEFTVSTAEVVNAPTDLSVTNIDGFTNQLTWTDTSDNEVGFRIFRKLTSEEDSAYQSLADTDANTTTYNDTGCEPATEYTYRIWAFNAGDTSEYSNTYVITTGPAVNAPSNLAAAAVTAYGCTLSWTDNSDNETGFRIFRKLTTQDNTFYAEVDTVAADENSYTDTSCDQQGAGFTYRIEAYNASYESDFSNTVLITTLFGLPSIGGSCYAENVNGTAVNFYWTDIDGEDGYKIERSPDNSDFTEIGEVGADIVTYFDDTVSANQTYYYRVYAFTDTGDISEYSDTDSIETLQVSAPINAAVEEVFLGSTIDAGTHNVTWGDDSSNESGFEIQVSTDGGTSYTQLGFAAANATSYPVTSVNPDTPYLYQVRSYIGDSGAPDAASDWDTSAPYTTMPLWTVMDVDSTNTSNHGQWADIALDSANNPHVSYYGLPAAAANNKLKYSYSDGSTWTTVNTDSVYNFGDESAEQVDLGQYSSIAVDPADDTVFVSCMATYSITDNNYGAHPQFRLRYAEYNGTSWDQVDTLHYGGTVSGSYWESWSTSGAWSSLDLDSSGEPGITHYRKSWVYYSDPSYYLLYSKRNTTWAAPQTIASYGGVPIKEYYQRLVFNFDINDDTHILFFDNELGYYRFYDGSGTPHTEDITGSIAESNMTMAVDSKAIPVSHFAYAASGLLYYFDYSEGTTGTAASVSTFSDVNTMGFQSIAIDVNESNNPGICYAYGSNSGDYISTIAYTWYDGTSWHSENIEDAADLLEPDYFAMAYDRGSTGRVHMVYYDGDTQKLRYARRNYW